ncbi:MAG: hypothetical protein LBH59_03360 [Planctomycetaceae bacterium]|nr:hypothetical protein [Planctomycetaceae bacterium]
MPDSGYQGLLTVHKTAEFHTKKPIPSIDQGTKIIKSQVGTITIVIKNTNAKIKTFKIMNEKYHQ